MSVHDDQWWVTQGGQQPVGPVSTDLVVRGIAAGRVPLDSFVCEVGGAAWKQVKEVRHFAEAVAIASALKAEDRPSGRPLLARFDASDDRTIVDMEPMLPSEAPRPTDRSPPRSSLRSPGLAPFDGTDDLRTVADALPPSMSDPSTDKEVQKHQLPRPKRKLEIVDEHTLTDLDPIFPFE